MVEGFSRKRRPKWVRILILLTALAVLGLAALELGIRPILGNMAEAYMRSIAVRCLNEAAIQAKVDPLENLKENVICGHLIPGGTGLREYDDLVVAAKTELETLQQAQ